MHIRQQLSADQIKTFLKDYKMLCESEGKQLNINELIVFMKRKFYIYSKDDEEQTALVCSSNQEIREHYSDYVNSEEQSDFVNLQDPEVKRCFDRVITLFEEEDFWTDMDSAFETEL